MSIIGDTLHEGFAEELEKAILEAINDPKWKDCRSGIKGYVRDVLYPLYKNHLGWCDGVINPEIVSVFESTEKYGDYKKKSKNGNP